MHRSRRAVLGAATVVAAAMLSGCIPPPSTGPGPTSTTTTTTTTTTTVPTAPTPVTVTVTGGELSFGQWHADLTGGDLVIEGDLDAQGNYSVPIDGLSMPRLSSPELYEDGTPAVVGVWLELVAPGSGTLDTGTGSMTLDLDARLRMRSLGGVDTVGPNCSLGRAADPIELRLTTGTTDPPPPALPLSGSPVDPGDGSVRLVENAHAMPVPWSCGLLTGPLADHFGLPMSPGNSSLELVGAVSIGADPIGPPAGPATFSVTSGELGLRGATVDLSTSALSFSGEIDADGTMTVPPEAITGTAVPIQPDEGGPPAFIELLPLGPGTLTVDRASGAVNLDVDLRLRLSDDGTWGMNGLGNVCFIGNAANPVRARLTTGATQPPEPAAPISGVPLAPGSDELELVDNNFHVIGANGCGSGLAIGTNMWINNVLGLPSPAGSVSLRLGGALTAG